MIRANTIPEAWNTLLWRMVKACFYKQPIQRGSFEGVHYRLQLPFVCMTIDYPTQDRIPVPKPGVPAVSTTDSIQKYFEEYLIGTKPPEANEEYTYASRMQDQLPAVMDMLAATPNTNQASIILGRPEDVSLHDPACLRAIDFKAHDGYLDLCSFWRSHDAWGGFPTNLGGLSLLQEYVAEYAGLKVGAMHYASQGTHIYDYQIDLVNAQLGRV